ncbi:helix-turn-helix domain-containing protein [Limnohabitans sp.]|jgi:DNA-binding transcriptional regulator YiaG|uniref:helix-turn-helix domain-containing protein n=1 Tax=Limnohabitans sp. TaxID=1907725 RepID=UPI0037C1A317
MSTFVIQLKTEIARIVKKESRAQTAAIKKSNATYRAEIAELKRRIASLELAEKRAGKTSPQPKAAAKALAPASQGLRFRADGFASLRKKLGLTGLQMAQLLGVSNQSVYHWETGKSRPRAAQLQTIAAVRKLGKKEVAARMAQPSS